MSDLGSVVRLDNGEYRYEFKNRPAISTSKRDQNKRAHTVAGSLQVYLVGAASCSRSSSSAGTRCKDSISCYGAYRSIPYGRSRCRDRSGTKCSARGDFTRCNGPCSWEEWLRDGRRWQERLHMPSRAIMDVAVRQPRFLEPENARPGLLQPGGCAINSSLHALPDEIGVGRRIKGTDAREHCGCGGEG